MMSGQRPARPEAFDCGRDGPCPLDVTEAGDWLCTACGRTDAAEHASGLVNLSREDAERRGIPLPEGAIGVTIRTADPRLGFAKPLRKDGVYLSQHGSITMEGCIEIDGESYLLPPASAMRVAGTHVAGKPLTFTDIPFAGEAPGCKRRSPVTGLGLLRAMFFDVVLGIGAVLAVAGISLAAWADKHWEQK